MNQNDIETVITEAERVAALNEELRARLNTAELLGSQAIGLADRKVSGLASVEDAKAINLEIANTVFSRLTADEQARYTPDMIAKLLTSHDFSVALSNYHRMDSLGKDMLIDRILALVDSTTAAEAQQANAAYTFTAWTLSDKIITTGLRKDGKEIIRPSLINIRVMAANKIKEVSVVLKNLTSDAVAAKALNDAEWCGKAFNTTGRHQWKVKPTATMGYQHHKLPLDLPNPTLIYICVDSKSKKVKGATVTTVADSAYLRTTDVARNWRPSDKIALHPQLFGERRVAAEAAEGLIGTKPKAVKTSLKAIDLFD